MNQAENEAGNKAIDSLINYETVKVYKLIGYFILCYNLGIMYVDQQLIYSRYNSYYC